jgi:chromate reductase, NAD(P)H dehydrogenase (quinone)
MTHLNLVGIVGSLRTGSANGSMARSAVVATPAEASLTLHDVRNVPFYDGDVEAEGLPDSVTALHDVVGACDGLIFFSPEYNGSFPAVTKNVIDWLTRPPRSWEGTPITMITLSPGPRAGAGVRSHFSAIMEFQPIRIFETLGIGSYPDKVDGDGKVTDEATLDELTAFLARFIEFCRFET